MVRVFCRAWDEVQRVPLCEPIQVFNSAVRALTTDEAGLAWAGSESGKVKCLSLEDVVRDGARISEALVVSTALWVVHWAVGISCAVPLCGHKGIISEALLACGELAALGQSHRGASGDGGWVVVRNVF
jgi:hypothetical protein